ncbi:hypothetical protein NOR_07012 [Metarhizium rileyi]|uniref:Uncharacterized protein n=1 Tax=Metarhizium rileyi (strain RCEF 4871) TaxID=1649241 RepID=A0A166Z7P0_METRR|nr:hypothetical protein NOR_07012 [Metarhizium rileyi RCEF 4871]
MSVQSLSLVVEAGSAADTPPTNTLPRNESGGSNSTDRQAHTLSNMIQQLPYSPLLMLSQYVYETDTRLVPVSERLQQW